MCGICGMVDNRGGHLDEGRLRAMTDCMVHRGPDDSGLYVERETHPHVGLGHRRLSIIDLSASGRQPIQNEDGTIRIILNGEIYNYRELRGDLEKKGHRFNSKTDTETVVHLYEDFGEGCVKYLRGMFAFAIWDSKKKILFLARDRIGKKPLIYCHKGGRFCFASEFESILESGLIEKKINTEAMDLYLTFGYIPAPLTIYEGIFKLLPAHTLVLKNDEVVINKYWQLDYSKKIDISEEDAASEVMRLLREAVKLRLCSDVPLGAFLSGGIDSSVVVALMAELSGSRVNTFSIGFDDKNYDELKHARRIAGRFNTDHHEFIVEPDALRVLPLLVERYGEPYADSSAIPTYYVCRETRRYVTVALNGDGGDESFAGYERYQAMLAAEAYSKMPVLLRAAGRAASRLIPDSADPKNKARRIRRFFDAADMPFERRYLRWVSIFNDQLKKGLYTNDFIKNNSARDPVTMLTPYMGGSGIASPLDRLLNTDTHTYLPDDLLVKVDIASMANSLEARSPFLDHVLMEFAASLPAGYKINGLIKKYILKKAASAILPAENIKRAKMGFGAPAGKWFRGKLRDFLRQTLLSQSTFKRGYFKSGVVRAMVENHVSGKRDYTFHLWALLALELWHRRFID